MTWKAFIEQHRAAPKAIASNASASANSSSSSGSSGLSGFRLNYYF